MNAVVSVLNNECNMRVLIFSSLVIISSCSANSNYEALRRKSVENSKRIPCDTLKVDVQPEIIGGYSAINKHIQIPEKFSSSGLSELTVRIRVAIDENGIPLKTVVVDSVGYGCELEAKRVISNTKFLPAIQCGKPVKIWLTIPVRFKNN